MQPVVHYDLDPKWSEISCSLSGVFQAIDITPANTHHIHHLHDIKHQLSDCTILADKGYRSSDIQFHLFESSNIRLDIPKRANQKEYKPQFKLFRKSRNE